MTYARLLSTTACIATMLVTSACCSDLQATIDKVVSATQDYINSDPINEVGYKDAAKEFIQSDVTNAILDNIINPRSGCNATAAEKMETTADNTIDSMQYQPWEHQSDPAADATPSASTVTAGPNNTTVGSCPNGGVCTPN